MDRTYIYVLQLTDNRYYVGTTSNPARRIDAHRRGDGSAYTQLYPPETVVYQADVTDQPHPRLYEEYMVKQYMLKHGVDSVRGGSYSNVRLTEDQHIALQRELRHARGECLVCGSPSHFSSACDAVEPSDQCMWDLVVSLARCCFGESTDDDDTVEYQPPKGLVELTPTVPDPEDFELV